MQAQYKTYDSYKDSGVPWLGNVPTHWLEKPFFAVAKQKSIKNHAHLDLLSVYLNMGVVKFSDVEEKRTNATSEDLTSYQKVDVGDLVLNNQQAWRGSVGVSDHQGIVSPAYLVAQLDKIINPRFANYLFRDSNMVAHYLISSKGVGTIQRNLYWDKLKRVPVFVPSIEEQERIVAFLDQKTAEIDAAIEKKQRLIELLKEQKSILINQAVTKGLNPSAPMKDSGIEWINQIPAHWEVKKISHLFKKIGSGTTPASGNISYYEPQDIAWVNTGDLNDGDLLVSTKYISQKAIKSHSALKLYPEDTLVIAMYGATIGKTCILKSSMTVNQACCCLSSSDSILPKYGQFWFIGNRGALVSMSYGGGQPNISQDLVKSLRIPTPPLWEQQEIILQCVKIEDASNQIINSAEIEIEKLQEFKNTLIAHAVTGKIKA